jgi:hypothetical protein
MRPAAVSAQEADVDEKAQPSATPSEAPVKWDRNQMEIDDEGEARDQTPETAPAWNKDEMAEERADGTRGPLTPTDELAESGGGLSGRGSNPGGGAHWAERDKEE